MTGKITKRALIDQLQADRAWIEGMLSGLTEEQMNVPGVEGDWSIKDIIAHLTVWERRGTQWITWARTAAQSGDTEVPLAGYSGKDVDRLNRGHYLKNKDRPVPDVLQDFALAFPPLLEEVEALRDEDLAVEFQSDWTDHRPYPLSEIVSWRFYHYRGHGKCIEAWTNQRNPGPGNV
jgi:hypothetical protein